MYFRTAGSGKKVVLNSNTYFGPNNEDLGNSVAGFSPNAVIGAARMAIYDSALAERKLLWVPAPHLYFDGVNLFTAKYDIRIMMQTETFWQTRNTKKL